MGLKGDIRDRVHAAIMARVDQQLEQRLDEGLLFLDKQEERLKAIVKRKVEEAIEEVEGIWEEHKRALLNPQSIRDEIEPHVRAIVNTAVDW